MSKRFKLSSETVLQYSILDNDADLNESEVVDLLNSFYEENEWLKEENEHLRECYEICKKMLSEAIEENELLECREGVYNVHRLKKDYEQLKEENEQLKNQNIEYDMLCYEINEFILQQNLGTEFVKFLR